MLMAGRLMQFLNQSFYRQHNVNVKKEIYAWGLRNPWRCSFDPVTGWLFAGDVGQGDWEEIDLIENGKIMAGVVMKGSLNIICLVANYPELHLPYLGNSHSVGYSITGGYVYRGQNVPELLGKYIYADYRNEKSLGIDLRWNHSPIKSTAVDCSKQSYFILD